MPKVTLAEIFCTAEICAAFSLVGAAYPGIYVWYSWLAELSAKYPHCDIPATINWLCGISLVLGLGISIDAMKRSMKLWP